MEIQMFSSSLGAMGSLLGKLRSLLVSSGDQLPDPLKPQKDKLELLKQDLEEICTLLTDLSGAEAPKTMAKLWMNEVRDLSYDIEDCIDKMMYPSFDTGEEIPFVVEEFSTLVKQASDARKRYHRYDLGRWASNPSIRVDGNVWAPTMDLVGIGDSRAKLINLLSDDAEQRIKVVSVLGPVGVGKTTLAKEVFRQIRGQFECRAFVRASKTPDTRRLLRSIISQVQRHGRPPHGIPVQELIDNLREHLQQKRYLILIDGLWETTSWEIVNSAFPDGANCSRILITTDIEEVALECCDYQSDGIFKMEPLSRNNSRELLYNRIFGSKHECSEELKEVSEEIVEKSGGLPLATICIASMLASQPDNSDLWRHVNECLSCTMRNNLTSEGMLRETVGMSYNCLSDHLKTCLLYLTMYPEGYTFSKTDLVKQWSAEGFISEVEGKDTSKVAEFYFDDLICRGLLQPNCIDLSDEVMFYTVHSTVFEVIRCKSIEDNFIDVIDYSEAITNLSAKVRRLSLTFSSAKYASKPEGITLSEVRSLAFYGLVRCLPSIMEFKLLRVLILEFWGDKEELDISGINKLFQLKYLRITTDMTVKLPANVQELLYLETLEIYARVVNFPSDAFDLPRLLHLCLQDVINLPDGIGKMRFLRTLQSFDLSRNSNDNVSGLNEMTNLRDLHLTCSTVSSENHLKRNLIALVSSLEKLGNLKTIILTPATSCTSVNLCYSGNVSSLPVSLQRIELLPPICIFSRLPVWIGQLQKLCILKIVLRELTEFDVYSIGRLRELTILSLYVRQPISELIVFSSAAFPVLKCFKFRCGVMHLAFQADAMPGLRRLKLEFNAHSGDQNSNMLAGIEHLLNLQEFTCRIGVAPGAEESNRKAAESVFQDAISKHSGLRSFNLRIVDLFDEEVSQHAYTPASFPGSDDKLKGPSMAHGISDLNEVAVVQEFSPVSKCKHDSAQQSTGKKRGAKRLRDTAEEMETTVGSDSLGRRLWVKERNHEWWDRMSSLACPEEEFRRAFRMSRATFEAVCKELGAAVAKEDTMLLAAIPIRQRVAVCLWRLATGEPLRLVSKRFGLGISTCHKLVLEVCAAIKAVLMPKAVQWPDDPAEVAAQFEAASGIANVVGAIYTTHIPIIAPKANVAAYYNRRHTERNQKTSYSITMQGVVDAAGTFTDVCIGWPGSMSNADVLEKSALSQRGAAGELQGQWVAGGASYPLTDWLMVPYAHGNLTPAQHVFNERMEVLCAVARDAFQRLKARWCCLQKRTEVKLQDLPVVLGACCVLHNICERAGDAVDPELSFNIFDDEMVPENPVCSERATSARNAIADDLLKRCSGNLVPVKIGVDLDL